MIRLANESDEQAWSDYLTKAQSTHHAFCWEWKRIIEKAFKHKAYYLIAEESVAKESGICGIMPIFLVNGSLFGSALISMPYLNAGGCIADNDEIANSLIEEAKKIAKEKNASYIELRYVVPQEFLSALTTRTHKVSTSLELTHSGEELFNQFPPKLRSQIRRPSKSGICAEISTGDFATSREINGFYDVFSEHMRDLGTPVFPKSLFELTLRSFGDRSRIITTWLEGKCIAGGITVKHGDRVEIPWASSLRKFGKESPNMLMYWEAIKTASLDGAKIFDFGRSSSESGPHKFKLQWGAKSHSLNWYYIGENIPNISPNNPKFSLMVSCWKKMPLWSTKIIGPWITRSLP